jgi:hypothetical protein
VISWERWTGVSGIAVADIPLGTTPDETGTWTSTEGPSYIADNYGQRARGYITPTTTGNHMFWIASDNTSELWLSTDNTEANKVKIAEVLSYTAPQEWDKEANQQSAEIVLTAGQQYYIEILHKEGDQGDLLGVGWAKPGEPRTGPSEIIPSGNLDGWNTCQAGGGGGPCDGLCSPAETFSMPPNFSPGNLGTGARCFETLSTVSGGNCGNFGTGRTLKVNNAEQTCDWVNWPGLPGPRNGGYCIAVSAGDYDNATFTTW